MASSRRPRFRDPSPTRSRAFGTAAILESTRIDQDANAGLTLPAARFDPCSRCVPLATVSLFDHRGRPTFRNETGLPS